MIAIEFSFPTHRYHATAWGRHVNEADIAWPPEPYRIIRAMIALWHRKADPERFPRSVLDSLVDSLCEKPPCYHLPPAVHYHKKHYMPIRSGKSEGKTLIFDAFAHLDSSGPLIVVWPDLELQEKPFELLACLTERMNYLGRSESWVAASMADLERLARYPPNCFCEPDVERFEPKFITEPISLLAPLSPSAYAERQRVFMNDPSQKAAAKKRKKGAVDLPETLCDAIAMETADIQDQGWNLPPGAARVTYFRPENCLTTTRPAPAPARKFLKPDTARFLLRGKPLPRIEDAVKIGELMRLAIMNKAGGLLGKDSIPPVLSGHGLPEFPPHRHAFFLPENRHGRIEHVTVHAPMGFDRDCLEIFDSLIRIFQRGGNEWGVMLESWGRAEDFANHSGMCAMNDNWETITPYLHPWHRKKNFGIEDQIRRECAERGLPEVVEIEPVESVIIDNRPRKPVHFYRFRSKRGLAQPDRRGGFVRLRFSRPLQGPIALGFGCHFGLGMFEPRPKS